MKTDGSIKENLSSKDERPPYFYFYFFIYDMHVKVGNLMVRFVRYDLKHHILISVERVLSNALSLLIYIPRAKAG